MGFQHELKLKAEPSGKEIKMKTSIKTLFVLALTVTGQLANAAPKVDESCLGYIENLTGLRHQSEYNVCPKQGAFYVKMLAGGDQCFGDTEQQACFRAVNSWILRFLCQMVRLQAFFEIDDSLAARYSELRPYLQNLDDRYACFEIKHALLIVETRLFGWSHGESRFLEIIG